MITTVINYYPKGAYMHNSNYRADQYRELRRRMNEMNAPTCNSCARTQGATQGMRNERIPCNPEGDERGNGWGLYEYPLVMVYAPYQTFRNVYKCHEALEHGTLFSELYLPFEGCK